MNTLDLFNCLKTVPGGTWLFTLGVCHKAAYFKSISPHVEDLREGYACVSIRKQRKVTNHFDTVHAIAMCNMAELAGGLMTEVSIPKGTRWIPAAMSVKYRKKANSDLVATAKGDNICWTVDGNVEVPVDVTDANNEVVFSAVITMNLKQVK